ncbi:MAG: NADH-quinone oxidoreductase subunit L, partial [Gammaproteobacteria bacterium]
AAGVDLLFFDTLVILLSAVIIFGWVLTYYADHARRGTDSWTDRLWQRSYALVSAELHLNTLYAATSRALVGAAGRLNVLLRWS